SRRGSSTALTTRRISPDGSWTPARRHATWPTPAPRGVRDEADRHPPPGRRGRWLSALRRRAPDHPFRPLQAAISLEVSSDVREPFMKTVKTGQPQEYVLPNSTAEDERLLAQGKIIDPLTRRVLVEAGLTPGMRVLDLGSGAGNAAM